MILPHETDDSKTESVRKWVRPEAQQGMREFDFGG